MEDPKNPKIKSADSKSKSIQTFASDMVETIEQSGGGLVKQIIHEQETAEIEKKKYSPQSVKNRTFTYAGFALLGVGLAVLMFVTVFRKQIERVEVPPQFVPLVFTNKTDFLDITNASKEKIANSMRLKAMSLAMPAGEVAGIYFSKDKKVIGFKDFLQAIESNFPAEGLGLVEDGFFTGIRGRAESLDGVNVGELFFVLKAESFVDIFPILREWEKKMFYDLGLFFQDGTSPLYTSLLTADFEDGFVLNKNARILADDAGALALMYIFVDDHTVVITASYDAAEEAMLRLSAGDLRK